MVQPDEFFYIFKIVVAILALILPLGFMALYGMIKRFINEMDKDMSRMHCKIVSLEAQVSVLQERK